MAEAQDKKAAEKKDVKDTKKAAKSQNGDQQVPGAPSSGGPLQWIIMAVVIVGFSGSGFILGRLFAVSGAAGDPRAIVGDQPRKQDQPEKTGAPNASLKAWNYEKLEPVVANPDVPGSMRYVRIALVLEMSPELDKTEGEKFLDEKSPILINWLNIYLMSLTLEDLRGDKNMKRIQSQILDAFNEQLWPESKPKIEKVLLKEFAVQ